MISDNDFLVVEEEPVENYIPDSLNQDIFDILEFNYRDVDYYENWGGDF